MTPPPVHPIQIVLRDRSLRRTRWTVALRLILAIPHFAWWLLWGLAALTMLPLQWAWALIVGGGTGLHGFYAAYVRLSVHLSAYLSLTADAYPPFLGDPGRYAVDVEIAAPGRQGRWSIGVRALLWLPPAILTAVLVGGGGGWGGDGSASGGPADAGLQSSIGVLGVVAVLAWFTCLARGRHAPGLRDLAIYCIGYAAQAYGYLALLTARYPDSSPALTRPAPQPAHPVRLVVVDDDRARSRLTVLFRLLLTFPHFVWLVGWGLVAVVAAVVNWLVVLVAGRSPAALHAFLSAYVRYRMQVAAFLTVAANPFPGFVGRPGTYPLELEVDPPTRQSRWITAFRVVLAVPALLVAGALGSVLVVAAVGAWVAALLTARCPAGVRDLLAFALRYDAQLIAYALVLTDRYPYAGPTLQTGVVDPEPPPMAGPPAAEPPPAGPAIVWQPPVAPRTRDWTVAPEAPA